MAILKAANTNWTAAAAAATILAAFLWGLYTVMNRHWGELAGATLGLPLVMLMASAALWILKFMFNEQSNFNMEVLPPLLYLMATPYLANLCWDIGTRKGNITILSLLADGLPWASLTVSNLYLGIAIGTRAWLAAFLIVSGALISRYSLRISKKKL